MAKYWYELYVRHTPGGEQLIENEMPHEAMLDPHGALVALIEPGPELQLPPGVPPPNGGPVVVTTAPPPPFQHPAPTTLAPLGMSVPYAVAPYSFAVQGLHPHHVSFGGAIHPHAVHLHQPPHPHMQMYVQSPQFQYPPHSNNQQFGNGQQPPYGGMQGGQPPAFAVQSGGGSQYQMPGPGQGNYPPGQDNYSGNCRLACLAATQSLFVTKLPCNLRVFFG